MSSEQLNANEGTDQFSACLQDPRVGNACLHDFHELLVIALCAELCGGQGPVDMALFARAKEPFLRTFLKLENGAPSHDTFGQLFNNIDLKDSFQQFMRDFSHHYRRAVAIDGNILRHSFDLASGQSALHMVSAWGSEQRLVLAQIVTDAKSNEITAVPKLLSMLAHTYVIVVTDFLNLQDEIAEPNPHRFAEYALVLKGIEGTLYDDVRLLLDNPECKAPPAPDVVYNDQGRIETRTATVSTGVERLQKQHQLHGLEAIGKVEWVRETADKTTTETAYYLLTTTLSPAQLNKVARPRLGEENCLRWRLDVVMDETCDSNRPHNLANLRYMALNAIQKEGSKGSEREIFKRAESDDDFLIKLLTMF